MLVGSPCGFPKNELKKEIEPNKEMTTWINLASTNLGQMLIVLSTCDHEDTPLSWEHVVHLPNQVSKALTKGFSC